jgi:hypothetical protein
MRYDVCPRCKGSGKEPRVEGVARIGDGRCLACDGQGSCLPMKKFRPLRLHEERTRIGSRDLPLMVAF